MSELCDWQDAPPEVDDCAAWSRVPNPLETFLFPDDAAGWAVRVTPGSATAGVLALLDPARLSQGGRVDALVALDRLAGWAVAVQHRVIAAMSDDPYTGSPAPRLEREWVSEDVKAALGESVIGTRARMRTAADLVHRLPDTLSALQTGRITARHAAAVVDTVQVLDEAAARQVEQAVLPDPANISDPAHIGDPAPTMAAFRTRLRRARIKADPRSAEQKAARAAQDRDVWVMAEDNAMAHLGAALPAEGAATVMAAVHAKANQIREVGDPRTKAQRRADGLVQICADYLNPGTTTGSTDSCKIKNDTGGDRDVIATRAGVQAPRYHGLAPQIQVSVALSTLLGLDEQAGELDEHGPIPADLARRLAADPSGTWRRLVTDELGHLIDYGRTTYRPPADLAQFVIARDRTCRAPGCTNPAATSDLHHVRWWSRGGHTNAGNLVPACERIHYAVHDDEWQVARQPDGTVTWTSPTGHLYKVPPATYPVDNTRSKIKNDTGGGGPIDALDDTDALDNTAASNTIAIGTVVYAADGGGDEPPF